MSGRRKIEERLRKKEAEVQELEAQLREARAYVQALNEVLKLLPREGASDPGGSDIREGSMIALSRDAIERAGRPLHVSELLRELGKEETRKARASLSGSLAAYVRRGEIFTRPRPNTFGLIGMDADEPSEPEPPEEFGEPPESEEVPF